MALDVREAIADSLLELCETRPLQSISVKDIFQHTGVSRQTFYNYFLDKNDLICWIYRNRILSDLKPTDSLSACYSENLVFYRRIAKHYNFMKQALMLSGQNCLRDYMLQYASEFSLKWSQNNCPDGILSDELSFAVHFHATATINTVISWVMTGMPLPPENLALRIYRAIFSEESIVNSQASACVNHLQAKPNIASAQFVLSTSPI